MKHSSRQARKFSIRFTVGSLFIITTILTSCFAIYLQYYFSRQMSEEHVLTKLTMASSEVSEYVKEIEIKASSSAQILKSVLMATENDFSDVEIRDIFTRVLKDNPLFYSIYSGNEQENFYQIINLESSPLARDKINATKRDRWVIIKINGDKQSRWRDPFYYTEDFTLTRRYSERSNYFPTQRPWYAFADENDVFKTEPYLFHHLKITGQTYAIKAGKSVLGIDIVLSAVNSKITAEALGLKQESDVEAFIFSANGEIIASNQAAQIKPGLPRSQPLLLSTEQKQRIESTRSLVVSNQNDWGPYDYAFAGEPKGYAIDLLKLISDMTGLKFEFVNGFSWQQLNEMYRDGELDILHSSSRNSINNSVASKALFNQPLASAVKVGDSPIVEFTQLLGKRIAVLEGRAHLLHRYENLSAVNIIPTATLADAKQLLLKGDVDAIVDIYAVLGRLVEQSRSQQLIDVKQLGTSFVPFHLLMKSKDAQLLDILQLALDNISSEQQLALNHKWLSKKAFEGRFVPYSELLSFSESKPSFKTMVKHVIEGKTKFFYITPLGKEGDSHEYFAVVIPERVITEVVYKKVWTSIGMTILAMLILLPISWMFSAPVVTPITALRKETQKVKARHYDQVKLVDSNIKEVFELSQSMMDMAAEIKKHQEEQEEFIEAFIRLIAQAIDDKSPYTAGHCNRVPEIGLLLAKVVEESNSGRFKDFCFANDGERREFRIAAWLHDCGKITTPEHIVDKGTKLEANYNRIHEIRTRFEVLWRDAEIEYLKGLISGETTKEDGLSELRARKGQLQDDFIFIANTNVGVEFMGEEDVERIQKIAQQTWVRHFDDRLGLSPFEELTRPKEDLSLPITEQLLSDKAEHIISRVRDVKFDPKYGIDLDVPEHQYNLGEIYNLSIRRGTLTAEDRFKINEHMISGIKMLENLPFPPDLRRVPRYASTHHETLKGTGYPRRLTAEDLSIPERILVIADIYEALTAADRPYKKAKPVSVAIDIMYKMALDEHLDMDLLMLFIESGAYLEYAHRYLPVSQIDDVDISRYSKETQAA